MIFAAPSDFEKIKDVFYKHKKWFPHIRTDYMKRMIDRSQLIWEDGIIITYHHAKRKQKIGNVQIEKHDTVLHQIANSQPGNGNAKVILNQFFEWCPQNVYLSVRKDNLTACQFYDSIGMKLIGETSWAKGTIPGNVYIMKKSENVSK